MSDRYTLSIVVVLCTLVFLAVEILVVRWVAQQKRRARLEGVPLYVRCWRAMPFVDAGTGDISITRCLAIFFAVVFGHMIEDHHPLSPTQLGFAIMVMSAAFGKSTFTFFLKKEEMKLAATETFETKKVDVNVTETKRLIEERHVDDGSPPRSAPSVGATVPE